MTSHPSDRPIRRISTWKAFGLFFLAAFLILLGVAFIPWDIKPIDDSDLQVQIPTIAPEENSFVWFEKAGRSLDVSSGKNDWVYLGTSIGSKSEKWDPALAAEILAANAAAFPELEQGLSCQQCVAPKVESAETKMPWLNTYGRFRKLLNLKSKHAQLTGDPSGSTKAALQAFRMGQLISNGSHYLIEWMVGIACQQGIMDRLEELVADPKTPDSVLMEIQVGLNTWDPDKFVDGYRNTLRGEYGVMSWQIRDYRSGKSHYEYDKYMKPARFIPYLLKPNMASRQFAAFYRHQIEIAGWSYAKAKADDPGFPKPPEFVVAELALFKSDLKVQKQSEAVRERMTFFIKPNSLGMRYYWKIAGTYKSLPEKNARLQAYISALRLKIALRLYEQKHGQLPEDLAALVPEFIKAVPNDPYDDKPFRYSKEKKQVWAIGPDGVDNGGQSPFTTMIMYSYKETDAVMPLGTREMKPTLASPPVINEWGN